MHRPRRHPCTRGRPRRWYTTHRRRCRKSPLHPGGLTGNGQGPCASGRPGRLDVRSEIGTVRSTLRPTTGRRKPTRSTSLLLYARGVCGTHGAPGRADGRIGARRSRRRRPSPRRRRARCQAAPPGGPSGGLQCVALQVQRLGAVRLRDAGVADQHVSQTVVCDIPGLTQRWRARPSLVSQILRTLWRWGKTRHDLHVGLTTEDTKMLRQ